jgi:Uma2 family endonuclease
MATDVKPEVEVTRHRFTVADYYRMGEVGILAPDARVELVCGEVIEMVPIGSHRASVVERLGTLMKDSIPSAEAMVRSQNPIHLDDSSEPEPDIVLVKSRSDFYRDAHPTPAEILLLIEVSDATLAFDRLIKLPLYATARIPEVWIIDLTGNAIEVNRDAGPDGYKSRTTVALDGKVSPAVFPKVRLAVKDILG